MPVEQALRVFLTGCGFGLPGESQKIDRFIDSFVKVYWQDNDKLNIAHLDMRTPFTCCHLH